MTPQLFRTGMMCACVRMLSSSVMSDSPQSCLQPTRLLCPWDSPEKNTGVGHRFLLQGIFLTQGSKPNLSCFLHWQAGSLPLEPQFTFNSASCREPGAVVGDPTHDKVRGEDLTRKAIQDTRDPPGWPRPLPHPVSSPSSAVVLVCAAADSCVACPRELPCSSFTD